MQRAQALLEVTTMAVKSIAGAVGYHDYSHFVRDFERATGSSPARFKKASSTKEKVTKTRGELNF